MKPLEFVFELAGTQCAAFQAAKRSFRLLCKASTSFCGFRSVPFDLASVNGIDGVGVGADSLTLGVSLEVGFISISLACNRQMKKTLATNFLYFGLWFYLSLMYINFI
eukprot:m.157754 g.157754  ORF g.157754 m.157754 type:complete len:108 (+) comp15122_c0_seq18:76-399(+)